MSKYNKSISFVDPEKLILLECHDGARAARTTDQACRVGVVSVAARFISIHE